MLLYLGLLCVLLRDRSARVICPLRAAGMLDCLPTERVLGERRKTGFVAVGVFRTTIKCSFTLIEAWSRKVFMIMTKLLV